MTTTVGIAAICVTVLLYILRGMDERIRALETFWRTDVERRRDPKDLVEMAKLTQTIIDKYKKK